MKVKEFTYTNARGITGRRVLCVTNEPTTFVQGILLDELSDEEVVAFGKEYNALILEMETKMGALRNKYDLQHSMRRFDEQKMQDVTTEWL